MAKQNMDQAFIERVGKQLKEVRLREKISQYRIDLDLNTTISRIENGKTNISIATLYRLCDYYDIPLSEFFKEMSE